MSTQRPETAFPSLPTPCCHRFCFPSCWVGKQRWFQPWHFWGSAHWAPHFGAPCPESAASQGGLVSTMRVDFMSPVGSCPGMALLSGPQASCRPCSVKGFLGRQWAWPPLRSDRGEAGKAVILHSSPGAFPLSLLLLYKMLLDQLKSSHQASCPGLDSK